MEARGAAIGGSGGGGKESGVTERTPDPPAWNEMPAPRAVMTLSWEDIWFKLCETLERQPTKEEVMSAFEEASRRMQDVLIEDFWICVDVVAEEYAHHD